MCLNRNWRGVLFPQPFEETKSKRHPEHRSEQTEEHSIQNRSHLFLGRLNPIHPDAHHGHNRPGHAFNAKPQCRPGPDGPDAARLPEETCGCHSGDEQRPDDPCLIPHDKDAAGDDKAAQYRMQLRSPQGHNHGFVYRDKRDERARSVRIDRLEVNGRMRGGQRAEGDRSAGNLSLNGIQQLLHLEGLLKRAPGAEHAGDIQKVQDADHVAAAGDGHDFGVGKFAP